MCGICGIYNFAETARPADRTLVQAMMGRMAARGPDDEGSHFDGPLGLGFRRLSIIDLSAAGHQPMCDESGILWLVLNGEIYNYPRLRPELQARGHALKSASDAEAVLHLYQDYGPECVSRLDGMFAFALWDQAKQQLLLVRDRLGIKPLYYHLDGRRIIFASSLAALLSDRSIPRTIDPGALNDYFALRYVPAPGTMVAGVRKLPPGHRLIVTPQGARVEQYWDIPLDRPKRSFADAAQGLKQALDQAVASHLMSDVPVAAFLSGGIDSSIVVGAMVKAGAKPETFSAGFGDDPKFSELQYAALVSDHWGLKNHQVMVGPRELAESLPAVIAALEEPIADPAAVPGYFLSRLAARQFKVVLTGEGADEMFAGYKRYRWAQLRQGPLRWLSQLGPLPGRWAAKAGLDYYRQRTAHLLTIQPPAAAYLENVSLFSLPERRALYGPFLLEILVKRHYPGEPWAVFERAAKNNLMERMLYADSKYWLADDLLIKMDKVSMAHSLEARVPLLDYQLVEQAWQVSSDWKYRGSVSKYPLREIGAEYLPPAVAGRHKHGFDLPLARWLREDLGPFARDIIMATPLLSDGSLNRQAVERLLDDHRRGRQDRSFQIFGLLTLALWQREIQP